MRNPRLRQMFYALVPCAALLLLVTFCGPAFASRYPEPSKYPVSWELNFRHSPVKRIVVDTPATGPRAYWYLTYTVTNKTNAEQQFLPIFEMVTNQGKVIVSDEAIAPKVFESIKAAEGNPLLESARKIAGVIHVGEDQARDGVAIWPEPQTRMSDFTIFISGLSGEFAKLTDDQGKPVLDKDGKQVILRKSLELNYAVWGDELYPDRNEVHEKPERWVMR